MLKPEQESTNEIHGGGQPQRGRDSKLAEPCNVEGFRGIQDAPDRELIEWMLNRLVNHMRGSQHTEDEIQEQVDLMYDDIWSIGRLALATKILMQLPGDAYEVSLHGPH